MIAAFYVLVLLQIALGAYSVWEGFSWLRMVRKRLRTPAPFYAPAVALICPCKGSEPDLEENLSSLTKFDYSPFEIYFVVADDADPALKTIERVKKASVCPVHVLIAGSTKQCGAKVHNLQKAVEAIPEAAEVLVFADSDVRLPRGWLAKLVAQVSDSRTGAATAYRWMIPNGGFGRGGAFASALASAWNASVATLLGDTRDNFCWGGGTAIRRKTFDEAHVTDFWKGAVSDDFAMTNALAASHKSVIFSPECLAPTLQSWTLPEVVEFTNRQIAITRVYAPKRWLFGALSHIGYSVTLLYGLVVISAALWTGDPWEQLVVLLLLVPLLAAGKGALRVLAVRDALPNWRKEIDRWSWAWIVVAPIVSFLFTWNFFSSLCSRIIYWRGIRYELISPNETRIVGTAER